jgi:hypothetical protein
MYWARSNAAGSRALRRLQRPRMSASDGGLLPVEPTLQRRPHDTQVGRAAEEERRNKLDGVGAGEDRLDPILRKGDASRQRPGTGARVRAGWRSTAGGAGARRWSRDPTWAPPASIGRGCPADRSG